MTNSKWITARAPSKEDADEQGHVLTPHSTRASGYRFKRWDHVPKGDPWHPTLVMPPYAPEDTEFKGDLPAGYRAEYRGYGWKAQGVRFARVDKAKDISVYIYECNTSGWPDIQYWELIETEAYWKDYWSKPSHFPPVCWLRDNVNSTTCWLCTAPNLFMIGGHSLDHYRWSDRPFDNFDDGLPCTIETTQQDER